MHFLIVKLSSIGDVVHTLPAVAALRRAHPDSRITWVVERGAAAILAGNPTVDETVIIDTRRWRKRPWQPVVWRDVIAAISSLRATPIDVAFDFQGLLKSGAIAACARADRRLGFSNDGLREEASRYFLTHQVVIDRRAHVIDKNLRLVAALGAKQTEPYEFPIEVAEQDEQYISRWLSGRNLKEFAIINPGGGWPTKLWSLARFAEVSDWLWERYGLVSLVTYGPGEKSMADTIVGATRLGQAHAIDTTLKQFIALTRRAAIFVGGDTGPLHLAAACRTPIVGIYGPTEPERNGPFDPLDISVGLEVSEVECRPNCYRRRCPTIECMDIPVAAVVRAIERRLLQTKLCQLNRIKNSSPEFVSR